MTPNGCDCFGCCELPAESGNFVSLSLKASPGCTLDKANDPTVCRPCTPVPSCINPCEPCELCAGKAELPAGCSEQICPQGHQRCGLACQASCPAGEYCVTGCCVGSSWFD